MFISKSTNIVPIFNGDVLYSLVYGCNPTLNDKQKRHMQDPYPVLTTIMSPLNMLLLNVDPAASILYDEHYIKTVSYTHLTLPTKA